MSKICKTLSYIALILTLTTSCLEKKVEEEVVDSPSTDGGGGGGGGGGIAVDSSSLVFQFTQQDDTDPTNSGAAVHTIPAISSPSINTSSVLTTMVKPTLPTQNDKFTASADGVFSVDAASVITMTADLRSHQVVLNAAVTTACTTTASLTCTVNVSETTKLDLSDILYSALTTTLSYFTFDVNSVSVQVPIHGYSAKSMGDINRINDNLNVVELVEIGNYLYAVDSRIISGSTIKRLIKIDKTANTTVMLLEPNNGRVENIFAYNNKLYMSANVSAGTKYFLQYNPANDTFTNLSGSGTTLTVPRTMTLFNNQMFFVAKDSSGYDRLFKIDTNDQIHQVTQFCSANEGYYQIFVENGALYTEVRDPNGCGNDFITYRLNANGTAVPLIYATGNNVNSTIRKPILFDNKVHIVTDYGNMYSDNGDGTATNINGSQFQPVNFSTGAVVSGTLIYTNQTSTAKIFQMETSGTIKNLPTHNLFGQNAGEAIGYNDEFYYAGTNNDNYQKLFKVKANGDIVQVSNINGNGGHDSPSKFTIYNNELYMIMRGNGGRKKLHKIGTDGRLHQVISWNSGTDDTITNLYTLSSGLYVAMTNPWRLVRVVKE